MIIKSADFFQSNISVDKLPAPNMAEYAFIGRSNVGKSSLINMLTQRKQLAKTSATPGKTITINHFIINNNWYLVDLPGYGFAKRSQKERDLWSKMLKDYLRKRRNLICTFVLIDIRIKPQKIDLDFINQLGEDGIPFVIVFTKADKLSQRQADMNVAAYKNTLLETWEELPETFVTSSESKTGREELLSFIEENNKLFYQQQEESPIL